MLSIRSLALAVVLAAWGGCAVGEEKDVPLMDDPVRPEVRSFRDWRAVCDNGADCFAYGRAGPEMTGFIRILMPAGPDAEPVLSVGAWGADDAGAFELYIDDQPRRIAGSRDETESGVAELRGPAARDLIRTMASGRTMRLSVGPERAEVSLSGVSAALLWIDERQGRLDTVTALLRPGVRPAAAVPPPPELPRIRRRPASISRYTQADHPPVPANILQQPSVAECREDWGEPSGDEGVLYAEIDPTTRIWGIQCFMAAYNAGHVLFLTDHLGRNVRPLVLAGVNEPVEVFTNVDVGWSIVNNVRGRGLGDCGVVQTWSWALRGFELTSERRMDECWGMPPDLWPTLWRTR